MIQRPPIPRREFLRRSGCALAPLALAESVDGANRGEQAPLRNALLVLVDDLRTDLGCYGNTRVRTPNIDRLASQGLTFLRSYCQQAASVPSRTSLLTGLRPDTTRVYDDRTHFRRAVPGGLTLPQHFRRHGYATAGFGRVFGPRALDDRPSWEFATWSPGGPAWRSLELDELAATDWDLLGGRDWRIDGPAGTQDSSTPIGSWSMAPEDEAELADSRTTRTAVEALAHLRDRRFFVAVGFRRPRLPLVAPERFFDLYPRGTWGASESPEPPLDAPAFALRGAEDIRGYADIPTEGPLPEPKEREVIRAYRACVSYVDTQIGNLMDALDEQGLSESTAVAVVGVNGSHLGELGLWTRNSVYEVATHAPLVVRAPWQRNAGRRTSALVESVDLFPSLCALCGIPVPAGLEGSSWRGLFDDPKRLWKRAVFSQHPRVIPSVGPGMGYSMRTSRHRYTEWSGLDSPYSTAELYDYKDSANELRNIANRPEHGSLVNGLAHMMREGWRGSLPPPFLPVTPRPRG